MSTHAEVRGPAADTRPPHVMPAGAGRPIWVTVAFACAAMLVSYLPFSAVNGVLGTIGATTGASTGDLQWVTDATSTRRIKETA